MAIQKKSLISGKSATTKKASAKLPQASENPGVTRLAQVRLTVAKVGVTRVASNKVGITRVASNKVGITRVATPRVRID
jgi:hypothetical protein